MNKVTTWDHNAVAMIKAACSSPGGLQRLFSDPSSTADELGFELDPEFESEIQRLNLAALFAADNPEDEELSSFLHTTIVDGRYLQEWLADPADVARKLNLTVLPAVFERIKAMKAHFEQAGVSDKLSCAQTVAQCGGFASKGPEYRVVAPSHLERF